MSMLLSKLGSALRIKGGVSKFPPPPSGDGVGTGSVSFEPAGVNYFGPGMGNQPSHDVLLKENLGVADTATRAIANRLSTLHLQVIHRKLSAGTEISEILDDNYPLQRLLTRPHPNITMPQLLRLAGQWIVTVGEAYWFKVRSKLKVPVELHPILPSRIWPVVESGIVAGYKVQTGDGGTIDLDSRDVIRFYFPDPENPWSSEGYLGPSGITADSLKFSGQHLKSHYKNDATPKTALETSEDAVAFKKKEKKRFFNEWRRRYHRRSGVNQGVPSILPTGYKLIQLAIQTGAEIVPLLTHWTDEQLMSFGVPKSVLGKVISGDRSSAETNQYVFDLHTIKPIANLIANGLTLQLAQDFDESIRVEFEQFVAEDKEFKLKEENQDLIQKVRSIDMVLEDRGKSHVPWGEHPVANVGQIPYDPSMSFSLEPDDESALEEIDDEEESTETTEKKKGRSESKRPDPSKFATKEAFLKVCIPQVVSEGKTSEQAVAQCNSMWDNRLRAQEFFTPEAEWERQIVREKKFVPAFVRGMRFIFKKQKESILAALSKQEDRIGITSNIRINVDDLFTSKDWKKLFKTQVEPIREEAFKEILSETLEGLTGDGKFVFTAQLKKSLERDGAKLIRNTYKTTRARIAKQLILAAEAGESLSQIENRIMKVFAVRRKEARTIGRTEIGAATTTAQLEGFKESGVVERKQWNTSLDSEIRDFHIPMEAVKVEVGKPFIVGGEKADGPRRGFQGKSLSAENMINCRCFLTPVIEE